MGMSLFALSALAQATIPGRSGSGRPPQQVPQLMSDMRKLQVTMQMARKEYFPGEEAEFSISVVNPGPSPLEVLEPFHPGTGSVRLYAYDPSKPKTDPRSWRRMDLDETTGFGIDVTPPTVWIQPIQKFEKRYVSSDPATYFSTDSAGRQSASICSRCRLPEDEGVYRYCYA